MLCRKSRDFPLKVILTYNQEKTYLKARFASIEVPCKTLYILFLTITEIVDGGVRWLGPVHLHGQTKGMPTFFIFAFALYRPIMDFYM